MTKEIPGQAVRQNRRQESRAGAGKAEQVEDAADTEYDQAAERLEPVGGPESTEAAERLEQASRPEIGQMAVQIQQATEPGLPGFAQATEVFAHAPGPGLPIPKSAEATPTPRCAEATRQGLVPQRQPQVRQPCSLQGSDCLR